MKLPVRRAMRKLGLAAGVLLLVALPRRVIDRIVSEEDR